jgi:hypothetical protein
MNRYAFSHTSQAAISSLQEEEKLQARASAQDINLMPSQLDDMGFKDAMSGLDEAFQGVLLQARKGQDQTRAALRDLTETAKRAKIGMPGSFEELSSTALGTSVHKCKCRDGSLRCYIVWMSGVIPITAEVTLLRAG